MNQRAWRRIDGTRGFGTLDPLDGPSHRPSWTPHCTKGKLYMYIHEHYSIKRQQNLPNNDLSIYIRLWLFSFYLEDSGQEKARRLTKMVNQVVNYNIFGSWTVSEAKFQSCVTSPIRYLTSISCLSNNSKPCEKSNRSLTFYFYTFLKSRIQFWII